MIADTTYPIADNLIINYALDLISDEVLSISEKVRIFSEEILNFSNSFTEVLDNIIRELIDSHIEIKE